MKNRNYIRKILITASLIAVFALSGCDEKDTADTQTATTTDAVVSTEAETEEKKTTSDEKKETKTTDKETADKTDKSDKDDKKSTKTTDKNTKETSKKETKTTENTKKDSTTASNDTESKNTSNNGSTSNNSSNSSSKTTSGGSSNSSGGSSSGSSGNSGSSQKTTEASKPSGTTECQHNWVWATKTVHHDAVTHVEEHYTEPYENPVYVTKIKCGICGALYDNYDSFYGSDTCRGGWSEVQVIDHYETVPAQLEWSETVVDKEAYDETVNDYQYCSKCGARKQNNH